MPCHPDRVRAHYKTKKTEIEADIHLDLNDVRALLDHLETEYVGAEITTVMRRLRRVVGYSGRDTRILRQAASL